VPVFCSYEAEVIQIPMDDEGMETGRLAGALERLRREGRRPKFIYTVPSFHNPAGVTLSAERRQRLVELAREHEVLVCEDNPYGLLRFDGEPTAPLYALEGGDYVLYLGTFSKILSPGIRIGWVVAPPPVLEKIGLGKQAADLCTSTLTQYFVREYFSEGRWREYVDSLVGIYRARRDVMLEALERHFPEQSSWTRPQGGLFLWATLPDYIDTTDLLAKALRENVAFVPGRAAYVGESGANAMRLNFSGSDEDEIREGIRRIGQVVSEQVGLYETITSEHRTPITERSQGEAAPDQTRTPPEAKPGRPAEPDASEGADVVPMRRRGDAGR
jgi:2-aminoadipate transaminase